MKEDQSLSFRVALAAAAGATNTIGLVSNVLLGTVWPPVLLAKEIAGIDGVSGGRLTLGIGIGGRPDDFVADGLGPKGLGKRIDADLGADELIFNPATDELDDVTRLAELVL